jgi:hypothetical protein
MNPPVTEDRSPCAQKLPVGLKISSKIGASDLLLSFEEEFEPNGKLGQKRQNSLRGFDVGEQVSLVIRRSTGIDQAVTDLRLKRIRVPKPKGVWVLHIVMTVDAKADGRLRVSRLSENSGVRAFHAPNLGLEPQPFQLPIEKLNGLLDP